MLRRLFGGALLALLLPGGWCWSRPAPDRRDGAGSGSASVPPANSQEPIPPGATALTRASGEPRDRCVTLRLLVPNFLHDQRQIWRFPARVVRGEHGQPALAFTVVTAGLVALDPYDTPFFRPNSAFKNFSTGPLRGRNTALATAAAPVTALVFGLVRRDSDTLSTALLSGEAFADAEVVTVAMKNIDGRLFPSQIPPHGNFSDSWFEYRGSFHNRGSFPSGHA